MFCIFTILGTNILYAAQFRGQILDEYSAPLRNFLVENCEDTYWTDDEGYVTITSNMRYGVWVRIYAQYQVIKVYDGKFGPAFVPPVFENVYISRDFHVSFLS